MKTPGILKLYTRVLCDNGHDKGRYIGKLAFCHTQLKRTALDYVSGSGFCRNLDRRCMDRRVRIAGYGCQCLAGAPAGTVEASALPAADVGGHRDRPGK